MVGLKLTGHLTIQNLAICLTVGLGLYTLYIQTVHLPRHGYQVSYGRPSKRAVSCR